ncbi:MAG: hypothetical protein SGPRY_014393 [Prymnesium sp.]
MLAALPFSSRLPPPLMCVPMVDLGSLCVGDSLEGLVVGHHRSKLFLQVPVSRRSKGGFRKPVDAMLKLPRSHPLLSSPSSSMGKRLTVFVSQARTADATLLVSPIPPGGPEKNGDGLSWRERVREAAGYTPLDQLSVGQPLEARVLRGSDAGLFVEAGVSCRGKGGKPRPLDALLPRQERKGQGHAIRGERIAVRVMQVAPDSARLILTQARRGGEGSEEPAEDLAARVEARRHAKRVWRRRLPLSALKRGMTREGMVTRVEPYGALVNVGARYPGLIHISLLSNKRVDEVEEVVQVGDRVLVETNIVLALHVIRLYLLRTRHYL